MTQNQYQAKMGFVGSVFLKRVTKLGGVGSTVLPTTQFVRVTSCNIVAKQDIKPEEVIDGRMDRVLYSIGGRSVEGSMSFPLVHDQNVNDGSACSTPTSLAQSMWQMAAARDQQGRLVYEFDTVVRYNSSVAYEYPKCLLKKVTVSVNQGEVVKMDVDVEGRGENGLMRRESNENPTAAGNQNLIQNLKGPVRAVTFNDFKIGVFYRMGGSVDIPGDYIRSFDVTVDNQVERFYTLNGTLNPIDIVAKKRTVEGNLKLMGFADKPFHDAIYNNQNYTSSNSKIQFGYNFGSGPTPNVYFGTSLHGVIFQIESVDVRNDLVETSIPFKAMGHCQNEYEAIEIGRSGWNPRVYVAGQNAGGVTSPGYFEPLPN